VNLATFDLVTGDNGGRSDETLEVINDLEHIQIDTTMPISIVSI
jgi:hypothetical protein